MPPHRRRRPLALLTLALAAWLANPDNLGKKQLKPPTWVATFSCCTYATEPASEGDPLGVWFPTREACSNKCGCGDFYNPVRQRERVRGRC